MGTIISSRLATLAELDSVYGVADAYLMLEVVTVDGHNRAIIDAARNKNAHNH